MRPAHLTVAGVNDCGCWAGGRCLRGQGMGGCAKLPSPAPQDPEEDCQGQHCCCTDPANNTCTWCSQNTCAGPCKRGCKGWVALGLIHEAAWMVQLPAGKACLLAGLAKLTRISRQGHDKGGMAIELHAE